MREEIKANVNWYPGHMRKATNKIAEKLKLVDFVVVVLDARAPLTSFNHDLDNLISSKRKLYILNKVDLADADLTNNWIKELSKNGDEVLALNLKDNKSKNIILNVIDKISKEKTLKYQKRSIVKVGSRGLVIGIPNVGKSTFINLIAPKKLQIAANTPGVTKAVSWFKIKDGLDILDSPGILEPKFKNEESAIILSIIGCVKEGIVDIDKIANYIIKYLKDNYLEQFKTYLKLDDVEDITNEEIYENIAKLRGFLQKQGIFDIEKAKYCLYKDLRDSKITRVTFDRI